MDSCSKQKEQLPDLEEAAGFRNEVRSAGGLLHRSEVQEDYRIGHAEGQGWLPFCAAKSRDNYSAVWGRMVEGRARKKTSEVEQSS